MTDEEIIQLSDLKNIRDKLERKIGDLSWLNRRTPGVVNGISQIRNVFGQISRRISKSSNGLSDYFGRSCPTEVCIDTDDYSRNKIVENRIRSIQGEMIDKYIELMTELCDDISNALATFQGTGLDQHLADVMQKQKTLALPESAGEKQ